MGKTGEDRRQLPVAFAIGLPPGHVLDTLVAEHAAILGFLDELSRLVMAVECAWTFDDARSALGALRHVSDDLAAAETHHEREDRVLLPHLQRCGLVSASEAIQRDNAAVQDLVRMLTNVMAAPEALEFHALRRTLRSIRQALVPMLRHHIEGENTELYPLAFETIGADVWAQMKRECDAIGYCPFSRRES